MNKYMFSVVMPVYKVEKYLAESIDSIVNQTIGFEKNIQLILVNDGSPDDSGRICEEYASRYPDNIVYVEQENQGVSAARNTGMEYIQGGYVNFLDSDDKWEDNAFELAEKYFRENDVNVLACRMKFFDRISGFRHTLDYKFEENRIVDITKEYRYPQLHGCTSVFYRREAIENHRFNKKLRWSQDMFFITEVLLDEERFGLSGDIVHLYRKRSDNTSAVDIGFSNKSWYIDTVRENYMKTFELSKAKYGEVLPYFQYMIMYDLQWRTRRKIEDVLSEKERSEYIRDIKELLSQIDDKMIIRQRHIGWEYKLYVLRLKYENKYPVSVKKKGLYYNGCRFFKNVGGKHFKITTIETGDGKLIIEGVTRLGSIGEGKLLAKTKGGYILPEMAEAEDSVRGFEGSVAVRKETFRVEVPISGKTKIRFVFRNDRNEEMILVPRFSMTARLSHSVPESYRCIGGNILKCKDDTITVIPNTFRHRMGAGLRFFKSLVRQKQYKAIAVRHLAFIYKKLHRKPVWIFSDRTFAAGDNGETLFRYAVTRNDGTKKYFVLEKSSPDFKRMKQYGTVLKLYSLRYRVMFLCADMIISSQASKWIINAFEKEAKYYCDTFKFDFVFLQHGIVGNDLSGWLRKSRKNIRLFVTSAKDEYKSILDFRYGYDENVVKLTGLPRYDRLENNKSNKLLLMPTWRTKLANLTPTEPGTHPYNDDFKKSYYCRFYNELINDGRLLEKMKEKGYVGELFIHPSIAGQERDFSGNDTFGIHRGNTDYSKEFANGALLVTDYSSVAFDFAYLGKPIVYSQFDRETFYEGQLYSEGYFTCEEDGFGPVTYNLDDTVAEIIKVLDNDCQNSEKYIKRRDEFFAFNDRNNCERVYKEILKLSQKTLA